MQTSGGDGDRDSGAVGSAGDVSRLSRIYRNSPKKTWGSEGITIDHPTEDLRLIFLPTAFMESCGDNTWSYVYKVLDMAADLAGTVYGSDGTAYLRSTESTSVWDVRVQDARCELCAGSRTTVALSVRG
jgi:hypothetical protein